VGGLVRQDLAVGYRGGLRGAFALCRFPVVEAFFCQFRFVGFGKGYGHHQAVKAVQDGMHGNSPSCVYVVMQQVRLSVVPACPVEQQVCHGGFYFFVLLFQYVIGYSDELENVSVCNDIFILIKNIQ
jgi:hypothetical protein